ncbi:hypothetical protein HMN09_00283000 [Mycena chlorophos]|uniref:Mitochondrial escape protein 2 n=1 Tax=Mycena chlorophos TaxID=658473 RepID=A0A8H6TIA1_MYCCL|nr:hypothetical protein HMN09_00283000 [Mycena chlorophos]
MLRRVWLHRRQLRAPHLHFFTSLSNEAGPALTAPSPRLRGRLFVDALPVTFHLWQLATVQKLVNAFIVPDLISSIRARLDNVTAHGFSVVELKPLNKDGCILVTFEYDAAGSDPESALSGIEAAIQQEAQKTGGLPSWTGRYRGRAWLVKGDLWAEDMWRLAHQFLSIQFEGPDVDEQRLYDMLRPYGHIVNMLQQQTVPAGSRRFITVLFGDSRDAVNARNALHGIVVSNGADQPPTKLHFTYTHQFAHDRPSVLDWVMNHPRIALPVIFFVLGTISYAIFDPIRSFMVKAKMQDYFVIQEYRIYRWLRAKSLQLRILEPEPKAEPNPEDVWKERKQAEKDLRAYLTSWPTTIAFVHGPQGSGKTQLLRGVLADRKRIVLTIDFRELQDATSEVQVINILARQVGYRPVLSFMNSFNNVVDMLTVGLMGHKANLRSSHSLPEQIRSMLLVVRNAIKSVGGSLRRKGQHEAHRAAQGEDLARANATREQRIVHGVWHDGRLDCVAGTGIIAELGVGDEDFAEDLGGTLDLTKTEKPTVVVPEKTRADTDTVSSLTVVVLKNLDGRGFNEEIFDVVAEWAAALVEQKLAHVVLVTDNRENAKRLAKALPSKPLQTIALSDADTESALAFVKHKLDDARICLDYTAEQIASIQRLGGRASDLHDVRSKLLNLSVLIADLLNRQLISKVRDGATVADAVEDIIARGLSELQKKAFADDVEDAKHLPWTREQAWSVFKALSKRDEVSYHETLLDFPFKGDEVALRSLAHADLISITTHHGSFSLKPFGETEQGFRPTIDNKTRPTSIQIRLPAAHRVFQATHDIAFNERCIASHEKAIKAYEQELLSLKEIGIQQHWLLWGSGNSGQAVRARYLSAKIYVANGKIEALERENASLRKVLSMVR